MYIIYVSLYFVLNKTIEQHAVTKSDLQCVSMLIYINSVKVYILFLFQFKVTKEYEPIRRTANVRSTNTFISCSNVF